MPFYNSCPVEFLHLNFWFEAYIYVDKLTYALIGSAYCWTKSILHSDLYQLAFRKIPVYNPEGRHRPEVIPKQQFKNDHA